MLTEAKVTAKYIEPQIRRKILRDHREGVRVWRIARDIGLSREVVVEVLVTAGRGNHGMYATAEQRGVTR